jgi:hypothetical protein
VGIRKASDALATRVAKGMSVESDNRLEGWCTKVVKELGRGLKGGSAPGTLEDMSVLLMNLPCYVRTIIFLSLSFLSCVLSDLQAVYNTKRFLCVTNGHCCVTDTIQWPLWPSQTCQGLRATHLAVVVLVEGTPV